MTNRLLKMHEKPDEHGFGTIETNRLLNEQSTRTVTALDALTSTMKELIYFIKWATKQTSGKEPPPYIRED